MTDRIERLKKDLLDNYNHIPICAEKMRYVTEALRKHEGHNDMIKNALAYKNFLDKRTIFIEDDQLLVGNMAARPHGSEFLPIAPLWPDDDLDVILKDGFEIDPQDRAFLRSCDEFWNDTGRCYTEKECCYYEDVENRLWDFRRRGMHLPAFTDRKVGFSGYSMGWGWSMEQPIGLNAPDLSMHLYTGYKPFIEKLKEARVGMHFRHLEDLDRYEGLQAMEIALQATIDIYERYADLADQKANECTDEKRAAELREMARICRKVPAYGAETYWEGLQALTVYWMVFAGGGAPLERMDMMLWPLLEKDLAEGRITMERAKELMQCFMVKVADYIFVTGMPTQREKYAGRAKWNVIIVGGCDRTGKDATNPLSYMIIEASGELKLPHPSIHVRVNEDTPKELMLAALKNVRAGMGFPSFISEKAYIEYLIEHTHGEVSEEEARDFVVNGCVDTGIPGRSRQTGVPMIPVPVILEFAVDGGKDKMMGTTFGVPCKTLAECESYEEFYNECFLKQIDQVIDIGHECTIIRYGAYRQHCHDPIRAAHYWGAIEDGRDPYWRKMLYEPACGVNVLGMSTAVDSLAAIKYVCFDKKLATPKELYDALQANWEGYEELRQICVKAPKYGNNDSFVDDIGEKLWDDIRISARRFKGPYDNELCLSAVSITTHGPGGKVVSASANGRFAGEVLSDASISPSQGADVNGPTAMILSAMRMGHHYSSTLHNAKFSPNAMKTDADLEKLAALIKTYLNGGGHQIQINVVDQQTLLDAQKNPEKHQELIVRVAGYSTFFTSLNKVMQGDVINRTSMQTTV